MTRKVGIVERLGDLARFYLMERPDGAPLSQSECDEIVSELSGAAAEITRLRAALAAETEECSDARSLPDTLDEAREIITSALDCYSDYGTEGSKMVLRRWENDIRAAETERCARAAEEHGRGPTHQSRASCARDIAAAIRARG